MGIHHIPLPVSLRRSLLLIVDSLLVNVTFISALWLRQLSLPGETFAFQWSQWSLWTTGFWIVSAFLSGSYDIHTASNARASISRVVGATSLLSGLGLAYAFLGRVAGYSVLRPSLPMIFWLLSMPVLTVWRFSYAHFFKKPLRRAVILGTEWPARELAKLIEEMPDSGYELVGFLDSDQRKRGTLITGAPVLGSSAVLPRLVEDHQVSDLIWACSEDDTGEGEYATVSGIARELRVQLTPVSLAYEQLTGRVLVDPTSGTWYGMPSLGKRSSGMLVYKIVKRSLDLAVNIIGLVGLFPLFAVIGLAIKLDRPGPVFYALDSLGKDDRRFRRLKFRTMVEEARTDEFRAFVLAGDPRVTRVGRLLRRTALDELPQLINVLRGEMSLVGPRADRPSLAEEAESFVPVYALRRIVSPGLTGWAQVNYSGKLMQDPLVEAQYDFYYIKHQSLYLDLEILFRTIAVVVAGSVRLETWSLQPDWNKALSRLANDDTAAFAQSAKAVLENLSKALGFSTMNFYAILERFHAFVLDTLDAFHGTKLPRLFPVLFLQRRELLESDLDNLRYLLTDRLELSTHVALLILFCDHEDLDQAQRLLAHKMRQVYAFDIIPLGREDVRRVTLARDPLRVLRRLVLSQIDLVTVSPFVITGPASETMFFGRETELREIKEQSTTTNYAVIGGRRIGKTSILKRLEHVRLRAAGFRALYHDCSFTPTQAELMQAIAADRTWFPEPPASALASFAEIIQALGDDKPLVILLDEADKLIVPDQAAGYPLFNTLRAMANADRCRFVLSGEQALRAELTNPDSPLYNFADEMLVGRLDFRAVEELITQPIKQLEIELEDEAEMVQHIWDFTSGHPNVVQRLCQRLIVRLNERGDRRLTLDDVETMVADPDFLRKDFLNIYWERATALERLCSLVMAADDRVRTLTAVYHVLTDCGLQVTLNQADDALERLVDLRNILERTAEGYDFAVSAFPEVIAKTARLDDLIALNSETYQRHGDVEPRSKRGAP